MVPRSVRSQAIAHGETQVRSEWASLPGVRPRSSSADENFGRLMLDATSLRARRQFGEGLIEVVHKTQQSFAAEHRGHGLSRAAILLLISQQR